MPSPNNAANNPTIGNCPAFLEKSLLRDERHELGTFTENHNEFDITDYIRPIQQNATQYVLKAHVPPMMPLSFNVKGKIYKVNKNANTCFKNK